MESGITSTQLSVLQSTLDMSRIIGDHTCLSVTSCRLHWTWPGMFPEVTKLPVPEFSGKQGHEHMLLLRLIRNVIPAVHCVQPSLLLLAALFGIQ